VLGAILATRISGVTFQRILGAVLILIVVSMLFSRSYSQKIIRQGQRSWLIYPALFVIGFYGGFIQVGVGFLFMAALYYLLQVNLVKVNMHKVFIILIYTMHKVFIILIYTIAALAVFAFTGNVNWRFGLVLAAGNALGGWWGAHFAVKGGEKFIRIVLSVGILLIALKLFNAF